MSENSAASNAGTDSNKELEKLRRENAALKAAQTQQSAAGVAIGKLVATGLSHPQAAAVLNYQQNYQTKLKELKGKELK